MRNVEIAYWESINAQKTQINNITVITVIAVL